MKSLPAISFYAPHWELVFHGILGVGRCGVKTRSNDRYAYRGPVLCYTSLKQHDGPMAAHGYVDVPRGVVGCANLADIRLLTDPERRSLFCGYNNVGGHRAAITEALARPHSIHPMDYGYFFDRLHRFRYAFTPPRQHMYGPVGKIPLYPKVVDQLPDWARP